MEFLGSVFHLRTNFGLLSDKRIFRYPKNNSKLCVESAQGSRERAVGATQRAPGSRLQTPGSKLQAQGSSLGSCYSLESSTSRLHPFQIQAAVEAQPIQAEPAGPPDPPGPPGPPGPTGPGPQGPADRAHRAAYPQLSKFIKMLCFT